MRRWVLGGGVGILAAVAAVVVQIDSSGSRRETQTVASVVKAFSARGIELHPVKGYESGTRVQPLAALWNEGNASRDGLAWVFVLRSVREANQTHAPTGDESNLGICGLTVRKNFRVWHSANVVVVLSRCVYTDHPAHRATTLAIPAVAEIMRSFAS